MRIILLLVLFFVLFTVQANAQSSVERGKKLYEEKKYAEAIVILNAIDDEHAEYAAAQYYLGRVAFSQKKYEEAADFFREATESKGGENAEYFTWLGNTYGTIAEEANVFRQGILAPKMRNAWEKAIALDSKNLDSRFSLIEYYTQAPSIMGGSMEKAKEMARQITSISPVQGHRSMGNLLLKEKNFDAAEKEYVEMVRLEPAMTPILGNFYLSQKRFDKAFALFDDGLRKNPEDMLAAYQLGRTCAVSGQRLDQGEDLLIKYLAHTPKQNEPSHAAANMRLAQIYEKKGKKSEAKVKYETALKMDNSLQEAKEGLSRVSKP